jgi:hypothetical protein
MKSMTDCYSPQAEHWSTHSPLHLSHSTLPLSNGFRQDVFSQNILYLKGSNTLIRANV